MPRTVRSKNINKHMPKPCLCGCGEFVKVHKYPRSSGKGFSYLVNSFIKSHAKRGVGGFNPKIHTPQLCACGCGALTKKFRGRFSRFIKGHENVGRIPWNKGRTFSMESRMKMRLSRLGKEPANKISVNLEKLHKLYVQEKKNASVVSKELDVPLDVVKNRLKSLGWSRSTQESCSTENFKEQMRKIRIQALISRPVVESPNRLEQSVYKAIDELGVSYQRQVPLFNKFVVDVFFPQKLLVLEIMGRYWHEKEKIKKKDYSKRKYLEQCGYLIEEIWDDQIKKEGVKLVLEKTLRKYQLM